MKKLNMFLSGKRGNVILDGLMVVIVLTVFGILGIVSWQFFGEINTDLQAEPDINPQAKANSQSLYEKFPVVFDNLFVLILVLITSLIIIASFLIDSHPIFFVFTVILLVVVLFIGGTLANFYEEVADDEDFTGYDQNFKKTYFIMTHLIETILVIGFLVILAVYGKSRVG